MVFGDQFLTGDAVLNPWNRVQALDGDLRSAMEALPECAETNPLQRRIDRAEQGMVARFLPEIDLPGQRCVCAISFVFPVVELLSSCFCLTLGDPLPKFCAASLQILR